MLIKLTDGGTWSDLSYSVYVQVLGCCAHGNEPSCSIVTDWQSSCWLLQKHCAACSLLFGVYFSETHGEWLMCCVLYRFVFTQCCITALKALTALTALTQLRTARWYRYKLCVISPYNCKCRPPHYKIFRVFSEVEHTHAQTDDVPCQLNCRFAHDTVLK